ncbi:hypothetical protein N7925_16770 [Streptomyces sp. CA-278952]|uniref:hypothetical protein n=1 Tax=unclassified Streptomyces TaxID=2593676 RepID=UPI0023681CF3|nr:hypothetical protein [Streptomyces sp. CA-278952]WDG29878.1 hypothetical protein N7925_16770 [Streptomyces sp. CA-278952]
MVVTDALAPDGQWRYSEHWLSAGDKRIVPVPAGSHTDASLARRIAGGCRTAGVDAVLLVRPDGGAASAADRLPPADPRLLTLPPPLLLITASLEGAILFARPGFALVAGTSVFLAGAAPEGVDQGRARFARYARVAARQWPDLEATVRAFRPAHFVWKSPGDVPVGTATAQQLAFMGDFAAGRCTAADFAVGWLDARRRSQRRGERVRGPLETHLDHVFSLLEDYSIDERFKGPDDLSGDELKNAVIGLLREAE